MPNWFTLHLGSIGTSSLTKNDAEQDQGSWPFYSMLLWVLKNPAQFPAIPGFAQSNKTTCVAVIFLFC